MKFHQLLILFRKKSKKLSYRASVFVVAALVSSLIAVFIGPFVPDSLIGLFGDDSTERVLNVMAQSMLVVVTFSMSTQVATFSLLSSSMTPRVAKLIMQDNEAQNALSIFLGSFIYSIVAIITLSTGLVGKNGKVVLFVITLLVLSGVVTTMVRWIGQLSELGRLDKVIERVQTKINRSLKYKLVSFSSDVSENEENLIAIEYKNSKCGYLQSIDWNRLEEIAADTENVFKMCVCPGDFVFKGLPIVLVKSLSNLDEKSQDSIFQCLVVGNVRTFDEDPMYGIEVLSEVASKALSPGINDPGSAIHVVSAQVETLFSIYSSDAFNRKTEKDERVYPKAIPMKSAMERAFSAIARDGSSLIEVGFALNRGLTALSKYKDLKQPAQTVSEEVYQRFETSLANSPDRKRLKHWERL